VSDRQLNAARKFEGRCGGAAPWGVFGYQLTDDEAWEHLKRDDFDNFLAARSRDVALKLQTLGMESEYSDSGSALDEED